MTPPRAPLGFLLDTATFLGNASVPLGLECVGAALAKLKMPKKGRDVDPVGCDLCARWAVDPPTRDRSVYDAKIGQSRGHQ